MKHKILLTLFLSLFFTWFLEPAAWAGNTKETFATLSIDSQTDETCPGASDGSVTITISGLVGTVVTYQIAQNNTPIDTQTIDPIVNNTLTVTYNNLSPGLYNFAYLSNQSETESTQFTISASDLAVQITPTLPTCNGDSDGVLELAGSGGTAPYTFSVNGSRFQAGTTFPSLAAGSYSVIIEDATGCQVEETFTLTQPDVVAATVATTDVTCNGDGDGSITITATGGDGNYSYSMDGTNFQASPSFTSLSGGSYTITIKDGNDCSTTLNATVVEPAVFVATIASSTNATCNGAGDGSVTFGFSGGGTPSHAYFNIVGGGGFSRNMPANGEITNLAAASYQIEVFSTNGCRSSILNLTIDEPDLLEMTITGGSLFYCAGESTSLTLNASGGTAPYMYSSDNGTTFQTSNVFPGLTNATSYDFIVKDANDCQTTSIGTISLTELDQVSANLVTTDISCFGANDGTITVDETSGGAGGNYQYSIDGTNFQTSNSFTGLAPGNYTVNIVDSQNCTTTLTTTISEPAEATAAVNVTNNASCNGASDGSLEVTTSNTLAPVTYTLDNGTPQSSNVFDNLAAGTYTITVTHGPNNCTFTTTGTVTEPTAINIAPSVTDVSCNGDFDGRIEVNVTGGSGNYTIELTGNGRQTTGFQPFQIFSGLEAGTYTVTATDDNGCTTSTSVTVAEPSPISSTLIAFRPSCIGSSDGRIAINLANGGTGVLQLRLQGTTTLSSQILNLPAGEYTVETVDQNGCFVTSTVTMPDAFPLTADVTVGANASGCGNTDGAFTLSNPRKGTQSIPSVEYSIDGINYQTNPSFTGLAAGVYTVDIRDITPANNGTGNCEGTVTVTISEPSSITGTISSTDLSCNGDMSGTITISGVSGGTAPYTYAIDGTNFVQNASFTGLSGGTYPVTVQDASGCTLIQSVTIVEPAAISATLASTDIGCNGANDGVITITASGGTGALQYSVDGTNFQTSNEFSALSAGAYTVTITDDNGCTMQLQATIAEPAALAASFISTTDVTCNGGSDGTATLSVSGGTAPYEASQDGVQFFPMPPGGVFTNIGPVTIPTIFVRDANGCQISIPGFTVNEPDPLAADVTVTDITCNGNNDGTITIVPTSTTSNALEYSIDGMNFSSNATFGSLTPGSYTITMRETVTGCSNTFNANILEPTILESAHTVVNPLCHNTQDGIIFVSASGGTAPYEYSLDGTNFQAGDFFGLAAGSYTVTVRDANNCTLSDMVDVTAPTELQAEASMITDATCNGASDGSAMVNANGGTAPYEYSIDAGTSFSSTLDLSALSSGSYTVIVRDANFCEAMVNFTINEPIAIEATVVNTGATCNGDADGSLTITASAGAGGFTYSIDGINFSTTNTFSNLAAGSYTITVMDAQGCTISLNETIAEPDAINLQFEAADISCTGEDDGQIAGFASGGTAPYQYSLDGTNFQSTAFSGLSAGSYALTVRDANGCEATETVQIAEPDPLAANIQGTTDVSCNGGTDGTITIAVTGGSAPYSYSTDGTTFISTSSIGGLSAGSYTITVMDASNCTTTVMATIGEPTALMLTAQATNALCHGDTGSISGTASGGTAPYEYSVDGTNFQAGAITGLAAGSYTLTARDANGCTTTASVTIAEPDLLAANITSTDASCNGESSGSISITATGGTAPYTYSIDGTNFGSASTFDNLAAGSYTITVEDANDCTTTATATIAEPDALTASTTSTDVSCNGESSGSLTITAAGGTAPYSYSIDGTNFGSSSTFDNLAAGSYTLSVEDANGCTTTSTATIAEPTALTLTVQAIQPLCNGGTGSAVATASGGTAPYEYSIGGVVFQNAEINGMNAGSYTVLVTDANGCTAMADVDIVDPAPLVITANVQNDNTIVVSASGGRAPYEFSIDGTNFQSSGTFTNLANGVYNITIRDANNCTATTSTALIITSTDGPFYADDIKLYPNPSSDYVKITGLAPGDFIRVINPNGKAVNRVEITTEDTELDMSVRGYVEGIYIIAVNDKKGIRKSTKKLMIVK